MVACHDPEAAARELAVKLATRSRHVMFLLGAGASCSAGLPDLQRLKEMVAERLDEEGMANFNRLGVKRNIEQILSRLRLLAEALNGTSEQLDGLSSEAAANLDKKICSEIAKVIADSSMGFEAHERLARWAGLSRYDRPLEIFTTNYDILIERGLESAGIPYFDGFVGVYEGRFRADLVDGTDLGDQSQPPSRWVRVWKLHGSVSWARSGDASSAVVRVGTGKYERPEGALAIYPSLQKYEESRRIPFVVIGDRLRRALSVPETLCVVSGYSFGDEHINQIIYDAASFHRSSEVVALFYADMPDHVVWRAKSIPNFTLLGPSRAVVGSLDLPWRDLDKEAVFWRDGRFSLGDFAVLAEFLLVNARQQVNDSASGIGM